MSSTAKFDDYTHIVPPIKMFMVAGGSAGSHTITGITTADKLLGVTSILPTAAQLSTCVLTSDDITTECTISAADTIDNTGGTDTTGALLLVLYADYDA